MKKIFNFTLIIDDDQHSLSPKDGLPFNILGELLINLFKAIEPHRPSSKCTVREIIDGSYGVAFSTDDELYHSNFEIVHKNIQDYTIDELDEPQKEYAYSLKRILGGKYFVKATNNEGKEIASIKTLEKSTNIETYFSTETLYGVLSQIGSPTVNATKKYIYIDGVSYRISISREQDVELKPYYTSHRLRLKVRHKRSISDGHIMSAEMLSFTVLEQTDIVDTLKEIGYVDFELIKDAHSLDEIVDRIYGTE